MTISPPPTTLLEEVFHTQEREDTCDLFDAFADDAAWFTDTPSETGPLDPFPWGDELLAEAPPAPAPLVRRPSLAPLLTAAQQYHADIACYAPLGLLSPEQKEAQVERARQGEAQARADIIHCLLHAVECFAARYYATYSWLSARLEFAEFVQVGNEALCLALERALETNHPYAYLLTVAYHAIRKFAWRFRSLITTPATKAGRGVVPLPVASFDAPLSHQQSRTLADLLDTQRVDQPASAQDEEPVRATIEQLPPSLRTVICRLYGFGGVGRERVYELCADPDGGTHSFSAVEQQKERALVFLYLRLQEQYPHLALSPEQASRADLPGHLKLVRRLEQAYAALQERGDPFNAARLAHEAHVEAYLAGEFLRQRGQHWVSQQARRLEEGYGRLLAAGLPLTVGRLVKEARVDWPTAREYLGRHGVRRDREAVNRANAQERAERLERASHELIRTRQPLTVRALAAAAHVQPLEAGSFLRALRGQASEVPA